MSAASLTTLQEVLEKEDSFPSFHKEGDEFRSMELRDVMEGLE